MGFDGVRDSGSNPLYVGGQTEYVPNYGGGLRGGGGSTYETSYWEIQRGDAGWWRRRNRSHELWTGAAADRHNSREHPPAVPDARVRTRTLVQEWAGAVRDTVLHPEDRCIRETRDVTTRFFQSVLLGLVGLLAAGCTGNSGDPGMATEPDIRMKSICVGRYTIDIPAQLRRLQKPVVSGGDATFYFGHDENFTKVDATVINIDGEDAFEAAVLAREAELKQMQNFATDGSMFVSRQGISPAVELISSYASADSTEAIRLEVHALTGNAHVVLAETSYSSDTQAGIQSKLVSRLSAVRGSNPSSTAFCIGDAAFDLGSDYEEAEITYAGSLEGVPVKLQFDINTFEQAPDQPALVERGEANLEGLGIRPEKLRAGPRPLAGDAGDEWLGAFTANGQRMHGFYAETRTRNPSRNSPKILVSLSTGDEEAAPGTPEMRDKVAIALWDRILASLTKGRD